MAKAGQAIVADAGAGAEDVALDGTRVLSDTVAVASKLEGLIHGEA